LIGNEKDFRFKSISPKKLIINPPSNTLHISNLKTEACNYEQIFEIFRTFGNVEAIKFKVLDHYKNMCLVKYSSLEESLAAMANLHDFELMKRFFINLSVGNLI
jgi:RNA recognition motif-containing protein